MIVALVGVQTFMLESCMTVRYSLITGISCSLRVLDDGYFRDYTFSGGLLVPECIIRPVFGVSART
jgi:hypothetical protein